MIRIFGSLFVSLFCLLGLYANCYFGRIALTVVYAILSVLWIGVLVSDIQKYRRARA